LGARILQLRQFVTANKLRATKQRAVGKRAKSKPIYEMAHRRTLEARFVKNVTCEDGTVYGPDFVFHKVWRLRNEGSEPWPSDTVLLRVSQKSNDLNAPDSVVVGSVGVGETVDIVIPMRTPKLAGEYFNYWKLFTNKDGGRKFGQRIRCLFQVVTSSSSSSEDYSDEHNDAPIPSPPFPVNTITSVRLSKIEQTSTESSKWAMQLSLLTKLGFNGRNRLIKLLKKYDGNLNEVLNFLVTRKEGRSCAC
jgi:hypothetical protein